MPAPAPVPVEQTSRPVMEQWSLRGAARLGRGALLWNSWAAAALAMHVLLLLLCPLGVRALCSPGEYGDNGRCVQCTVGRYGSGNDDGQGQCSGFPPTRPSRSATTRSVLFVLHGTASRYDHFGGVLLV